MARAGDSFNGTGERTAGTGDLFNGTGDRKAETGGPFNGTGEPFNGLPVREGGRGRRGGQE
jgi:hypothetical protein